MKEKKDYFDRLDTVLSSDFHRFRIKKIAGLEPGLNETVAFNRGCHLNQEGLCNSWCTACEIVSQNPFTKEVYCKAKEPKMHVGTLYKADHVCKKTSDAN